MSASAARQGPLFLGLESRRIASEWTLEGRRGSQKSDFQKEKYSKTKPKQLQSGHEVFDTQWAQHFLFTYPASTVLASFGAPNALCW